MVSRSDAFKERLRQAGEQARQTAVDRGLDERLGNMGLPTTALTGGPRPLEEICALTDTLILDEDGCYNPMDFNDQLILGLKGAMSQAELHIMRARLQGGKLHKAKKGQLRFALPVGLCFDEQNNIGRNRLAPCDDL